MGVSAPVSIRCWFCSTVNIAGLLLAGHRTIGSEPYFYPIPARSASLWPS